MMDKLKKFRKEYDDGVAGLSKLFDGGLGTFLGKQEAFIVSLMEKVSGDKYQWISWYVYDNDWGKGGLKANNPGEKGKKIDTYKKLYDMINYKKK